MFDSGNAKKCGVISGLFIHTLDGQAGKRDRMHATQSISHADSSTVRQFEKRYKILEKHIVYRLFTSIWRWWSVHSLFKILKLRTTQYCIQTKRVTSRWDLLLEFHRSQTLQKPVRQIKLLNTNEEPSTFCASSMFVLTAPDSRVPLLRWEMGSS